MEESVKDSKLLIQKLENGERSTNDQLIDLQKELKSANAKLIELGKGVESLNNQVCESKTKYEDFVREVRLELVKGASNPSGVAANGYQKGFCPQRYFPTVKVLN